MNAVTWRISRRRLRQRRPRDERAALAEKEFLMKKVTMYSLSTCPWCKKARRYFEEQAVPLEYTDYDRADDDTQQRIDRDMHEIGAGGFPVVKIGRDVVVGYHPERYKELLLQNRDR